MNNVIDLLRVSTDHQDVARQQDDLEDLHRTFNLNPVRTLQLFGVSGTAVLGDQDMQRLLDDLKRPEIHGISVSALDRLFRPKRYETFRILDYFVDTNKVIWSTREGFVDPSTDEGFDKCCSAGAKAGSEWRELRRRTGKGRKQQYQKGFHVSSTRALPRGVGYEAIRDFRSGRQVGGKWFHVEPYVSHVKKAFELLFAGWSIPRIAEEVEQTPFWVWTTLQNPIWIGIRRSEKFGNQPIDLEPILPPKDFERAQTLLRDRQKLWQKRRAKGESRHLCTGVAQCNCGKSLYSRFAGGVGRRFDYYFCASWRKKYHPYCGAETIRRDILDAAVENLMTEHLLEKSLLATLFKQALGTPKPQKPDPNKRVLADLQATRKRIIQNFEDGDITREEKKVKLRNIDAEIRAAEAVALSQESDTLDPQELAKAIAETFAGFSELPLLAKRELLRRAVRKIVVDNGKLIRGITFRGNFLGEISGVNALSRLTSTKKIYSPLSDTPDIPLTFPKPLEIRKLAA